MRILTTTVDAVGPLQGTAPQDPSNQGQYAMQSAVLTIELGKAAAKQVVNQATKATLVKKSAKRAAVTRAVQPLAKRAKTKKVLSSSDDE